MLKAQKNYSRLGTLGGFGIHHCVLVFRQVFEYFLSLIWGHTFPSENPPGLQDSSRTKSFSHLLVVNALANCSILEKWVDLLPLCPGKKFAFSRCQILQGNFCRVELANKIWRRITLKVLLLTVGVKDQVQLKALTLPVIRLQAAENIMLSDLMWHFLLQGLNPFDVIEIQLLLLELRRSQRWWIISHFRSLATSTIVINWQAGTCRGRGAITLGCDAAAEVAGAIALGCNAAAEVAGAITLGLEAEPAAEGTKWRGAGTSWRSPSG